MCFISLFFCVCDRRLFCFFYILAIMIPPWGWMQKYLCKTEFDSCVFEKSTQQFYIVLLRVCKGLDCFTSWPTQLLFKNHPIGYEGVGRVVSYNLYFFFFLRKSSLWMVCLHLYVCCVYLVLMQAKKDTETGVTYSSEMPYECLELNSGRFLTVELSSLFNLYFSDD